MLLSVNKTYKNNYNHAFFSDWLLTCHDIYPEMSHNYLPRKYESKWGTIPSINPSANTRHPGMKVDQMIIYVIWAISNTRLVAVSMFHSFIPAATPTHTRLVVPPTSENSYVIIRFPTAHLLKKKEAHQSSGLHSKPIV